MLCKWRVKNADAFPKIRMRLGHEGVNFDTPSFFLPSTEPPDGIFHANPLSKHFGFTFFAIDPIASRLKKITLIHACFVRGILKKQP